MRFLWIVLVLVFGSSVAAQEIMGFSRADFGQVVLNQKQSASGDMEFELSVGQYNNEAITNYSTNSIFAQIGRAVGRLDILTDGGVFPCTAFIVSENHIVTNYHCVPGIVDNDQANISRIQAVQFVAGYTLEGVEEGTAIYQVNPQPIEADKKLDFAVLEVFGNPSRDWGTLRIAANAPNAKDPYWVIGHPMGESQRISREKCRAAEPALSRGVLRHTCDTLPGNSGSPVIDASLQMVIALHHAGSRRNSVNYAIPMARILERSPTLAALRTKTPGEIEADTARQMEELAGRAATLRAELESALQSAENSGAQAQDEIEKLGAALSIALAELAAQRADAVGAASQSSEEREKLVALQNEMAGLQEQLGQMQELRTQREAAEARLLAEEARKNELAAESKRLQDELARTQAALDIAANQTAPALTELRTQRIDALKASGTRRAWQLFVSNYGTEALDSPDMVTAANEIEEIWGRDITPGKIFEELLGLSDNQRKAVQLGLDKAGLNPGPADGAFGGRTRSAIARWNAQNGLEDTKFVNAAMLSAFGIRWTLLIPLEFKSSERARVASAQALRLLGEDADIIKRVSCLGFDPTIYGRFDGHFYVAVRSPKAVKAASFTAERCGGGLVKAGSAAERAYLTEMLGGDLRFFGGGSISSAKAWLGKGSMAVLFQTGILSRSNVGDNVTGHVVEWND